MKLKDIPSASGILKGICIYADTKERFDELMGFLGNGNWRWADGSFPFEATLKLNYRYVYLFPDKACIRRETMYKSVWNCVNFWLEPIDDWNQDAVMELKDVATVAAPKNNDCRDLCYWCGAPCKQVQGITNTYTVCTKCGK